MLIFSHIAHVTCCMAAEMSQVSRDKNCHMQLVGGRNELKWAKLAYASSWKIMHVYKCKSFLDDK